MRTHLSGCERRCGAPTGPHADLVAPFLDRGVRMLKVRTGPEWRQDLETLTRLRELLPGYSDDPVAG